MIEIALIGIMILGWSLGRNNLSNLFGTAIGTGMVHLKSAAMLAFVFIFMGAFLSGSATTSSVLALGDLRTPLDIITVMISAAIVLELLSKCGIPASIVQTIMGALIGWNFFYRVKIDWELVLQMIVAWFWAPLIAAVMAFILMRKIRKVLFHHPIPLFLRDRLIRIGLILVGIWAAYTLGANNTGVMTGPFFSISAETIFGTFFVPMVTFLICLAIGIGCFWADKKVITTVGRKLFPLSPTEALVVMLGTALSMTCFSMQFLRNVLIDCHLPAFPLVPIPISNVMIGAIFGISLTKGGNGLRWSVLGRILISWILVPVVAGFICYLFLWIRGI